MHAKNNNESAQSLHRIKAFGFGTLFGIIALFLLNLLLASIASAVDLSYTVLTGLAIAAMACGAFVSGFFSAKMIGSRGMVVGAISGAILAVLFVVIGLCLFPASFGILTMIKVIIMIFLALCGGIFGVNSKKSHR